MKRKLIAFVMLLASVCTLVQALNHSIQNFTTGDGNTNLVTFVWSSATNVVYTLNFADTNVSVGTLAWKTDGGTSISQGTNSTGTSASQNWTKLVSAGSDSNGNVGKAALALTVYGSATNGIVFTFSRCLDTRVPGAVAAFFDTNNVFSVGITNSPAVTTPFVIVTNMPDWMLTGTRAFRLEKVVFATNSLASTNYFSIGYSTYNP